MGVNWNVASTSVQPHFHRQALQMHSKKESSYPLHLALSKGLHYVTELQANIIFHDVCQEKDKCSSKKVREETEQSR